MTFIQSRLVIVICSFVSFHILRIKYDKYLLGTKDIVEWQESILYMFCTFILAMFIKYSWELIFGTD